jgi:hypothetical protein
MRGGEGALLSQIMATVSGDDGVDSPRQPRAVLGESGGGAGGGRCKGLAALGF